MKKIVIYGNCHTIPIAYMLEKALSETGDYVVIPCTQIQNIKDSSYFDQDFIYEADFFVHMDIRKDNGFGYERSSEYVISKLSKKCTTIAIPNLFGFGKCFFPQICSDDLYLNDTHGNKLFLRDSIIDGWLDEHTVCKTGKLKRTYDTALDGKLNFAHDLNGLFSKIESREAKWDIKILGFIKDNYRNHQLFYEPNHPTEMVFKYIVHELLINYFIASVDEDLLQNAYETSPRLDNLEIPILKCVKDAYDLQWDNHDHLRMSKDDVWHHMNIDSYVDYYCAYSSLRKDINILQRMICGTRLVYLKKFS